MYQREVAMAMFGFLTLSERSKLEVLGMSLASGAKNLIDSDDGGKLTSSGDTLSSIIV